MDYWKNAPIQDASVDYEVDLEHRGAPIKGTITFCCENVDGEYQAYGWTDASLIATDENDHEYPYHLSWKDDTLCAELQDSVDEYINEDTDRMRGL